jgi:hypothetical protein
MLGADLSAPAGNALAASAAALARALKMQTIAADATMIRVDIRQMAR